MRYLGQTYQIPLEQTGFNHNKNLDTIPPNVMVHPSRNVLMNEGGVRKRGGTSKVDSKTMGAVDVTGLFDFTLADTTQFIVRATSDGKLWEDVETTIKTGWTEDKIVHIMQWEDEIFFCNGADNPTVWDGDAADTTDVADVPTDWTGTNFPKQMIQHGSGNSLRNWALGCPGTPKTIYVTPDGAPKDFTQGTVLTFNLETGDGFGIVGGIEFGDRLILFGKNRSFIIDDTDSSTSNWGYHESQWYGGAANHRLIVKTQNDIICMMEDGEIYSVAAAESYGDYRAASLTRPSFMHEWIKTYLALSIIDSFHATYDPALRAILFFVARNGETELNTALCYFIDRPPDRAWTILDNQDFVSGYSAMSSALVRQAAGAWKVYTGNYAGRVWKLNESNRSDNSEAYVANYKTPMLAFDDPRLSKRYDRVKVVSTSEGTTDATLRWWVDGELIADEALTFAVDGGVLGSFTLGTSALGGANILENSVRLGQIGKRIQLELISNAADTDFFFSQILIDFIPLGAKP